MGHSAPARSRCGTRAPSVPSTSSFMTMRAPGRKWRRACMSNRARSTVRTLTARPTTCSRDELELMGSDAETLKLTLFASNSAAANGKNSTPATPAASDRTHLAARCGTKDAVKDGQHVSAWIELRLVQLTDLHAEVGTDVHEQVVALGEELSPTHHACRT
eukprot:scaffold68532_cov70-Phaeocystis_antarctica.AAC.5